MSKTAAATGGAAGATAGAAGAVGAAGAARGGGGGKSEGAPQRETWLLTPGTPRKPSVMPAPSHRSPRTVSAVQRDERRRGQRSVGVQADVGSKEETPASRSQKAVEEEAVFDPKECLEEETRLGGGGVGPGPGAVAAAATGGRGRGRHQVPLVASTPDQVRAYQPPIWPYLVPYLGPYLLP